MARRKKLINKKVKKLIQKKCYFCPCDIYDLLDVHRIVPGKEGHGYIETNTVVCCSLCHRKIHAGIIKIDRFYPSTSGQLVLHYWDQEVECWK